MNLRFLLVIALSIFLLFPSAMLAAGSSPALSAVANASLAARQDTNGFVMASIEEPQSLDPAFDYESAGAEVLQNVYEPLIGYDRSDVSTLVPLLCTQVPTLSNGRVTSDGLNYTYTIRSGVKFHNGAVMTAEDVEYSLERVLMMNDPQSPAWMLGQVMIPGYSSSFVPSQDLIDNSVTINGNDVTIHLIRPYPAFNQIMANAVTSVISKNFIEAHGGVVRGQSFNDYLNTHTCGTGPFMLKEWVIGSHWTLERFDDYRRTPAALESVVCQKIDDYGTRLSMLYSGDADSIYVPPGYENDVRGAEGIEVMEGYPSFSIGSTGFNQNISHSDSLDQGDVPSWFFADAHVRNAFAHAFDYDYYIQNVLSSRAVKSNGAIPQGMFGYSDEIPTYQMDLQQAAIDLQLAIDNRSGQSYADEGFRIVLFTNLGNFARETQCLLLKSGLESLTSYAFITGTITVDVQYLNFQTYLSAWSAKVLPIYFAGWAPDFVDPDDYTQPFYSEFGLWAVQIGLNDPVLTQMVNNASAEMNLAERAAIYKEISWYGYNNSFYIWTNQMTSFHVQRDWVDGYVFNPMDYGLYYYDLSLNIPEATPSAPLSVVATSGEGSITLTWDPPAYSNDSAITAYLVSCGESPSSMTSQIMVDQLSYYQYGLAKGQTFYFKVAAQNNAGWGPNSTTVMGTSIGVPNAPENLTATAGNNQVQVAWELPNYAGPGTLTYHLFRDGASIWNGSTSSHLDTTAMNGKTYAYNVAASNSVGWGLNTTLVRATPIAPIIPVLPGVPRSLHTTAGDGHASLSWSAPSNPGSSVITGYKIYRGESASSLDYLTTVSGTAYTDSSLTNGLTYYYSVSAISSVGESGHTDPLSVTPNVPSIGGGQGIAQLAAIGAMVLIAVAGIAITLYVRKK
jgi:peptide/nickel transport system substrate-binding protein